MDQFLTSSTAAAAVIAGFEDGKEKEEGEGEGKNSHLQSRMQQPAPLQLLRPLPCGRQMVEAWCGSEFSLVADECGELWGCGWNEHGNLGSGTGAGAGAGSSEGSWCRAVIDSRVCKKSVSESVCVGQSDSNPLQIPVRLHHVWEGALACGGGHVVCLSRCL
jgi:alpha-tubulin suppressor-like RCC1 family protein